MELYIRNLSYAVTEADLVKAFGRHGSVTKATVIKDRETGRSRGFGFVEYDNVQSAQRALAEMQGAELCGRRIELLEARPRGERVSRTHPPETEQNNSVPRTKQAHRQGAAPYQNAAVPNTAFASNLRDFDDDFTRDRDSTEEDDTRVGVSESEVRRKRRDQKKKRSKSSAKEPGRHFEDGARKNRQVRQQKRKPKRYYDAEDDNTFL